MICSAYPHKGYRHNYLLPASAGCTEQTSLECEKSLSTLNLGKWICEQVATPGCPRSCCLSSPWLCHCYKGISGVRRHRASSGGRIWSFLVKYVLLLKMKNWVINLCVLQSAEVPWLLFSHHISGSYSYLLQEMLIIIHLTDQLCFKGQGIYLPIPSVSLADLMQGITKGLSVSVSNTSNLITPLKYLRYKPRCLL